MTAQSQTKLDQIDRPAVPLMQTTLSSAQTVELIVIAAVYWFIAAMFIRFFGVGLFVADNPWLIVLFIGSLPVAWLIGTLPCRLMGLARPQILPAVTLMTIIAVLLDGLAITWFPTLYGLAGSELALAAAWLLWGVGAGLAFAYLIWAEVLPA